MKNNDTQNELRKNKNKRVVLAVTGEQKKILDKVALSEKKFLSAILNKAIEEYLLKYGIIWKN